MSRHHQLPYLLESQWDVRIVALSWLCSFFCSFSTAVVMVQASSSRSRVARVAWILAASLCFGFGSVWSMHFVGMSAANIGVNVDFEPGLTVLSALLAVLFSFIALATVSFVDFIPAQRKSKKETSRPALKQKVTSYFAKPESRRPSLADVDDSREPLLSDYGEAQEEDVKPKRNYGRNSIASPGNIPAFASANTPPPVSPSQLPTPPALLDTPPANSPPSTPLAKAAVRKPSALRQAATPPVAAESAPIARRPSASEASESTDSLVGSNSETTVSSSSNPSWLDHFLTPNARARMKKGDNYKPEHWSDYVVRRFKVGLQPVYFVSSFVYAFAIVAMHYTGMAAMRSRSGELQIEFSALWVAVSALIAFVDCFVACCFLIELEASILRQGAFALIAATGVCLMHYSGARAASFYSSVPGNHAAASFPGELIAAIVICAILISLISNTILAYMATLSRNRLAENILIKRRAWRLLAQKEAAEQANALKSTFISTASHELRTPLHTVSGYCELLLRTELDEEQSLYLESIRRACHQLNIMTRSVLDFSKLERGGEEHALPEFVNLRETIINVAELCEERRGALNVREAKAGEVQLLIDIDASSPEAVFTDEVFLCRVATNLISNALKFTAAPGMVALTVTYAAGRLSLVVEDCGIGIPAKYLPALFEPFTQADSSLTRRHAGTGLGLAICKQLVDRLRGEIKVDSTEGKGSTFTVSLPIDQVHLALDHDAPPMAKGTMAVFCLHPATRAALSTIWRKRGWQIVERQLEDPVEHFETATVIWTEALALEAHPALLKAMSAEGSTFSVPTFVPYADDASLAEHLEVFGSSCVVRLKMPIVAHRLAELLDDPTPHMQRNARHSDRPKLVRFASALSSDQTTAGSTVSAATSMASSVVPSPDPATSPRSIASEKHGMLERASPELTLPPLSPTSKRIGSPQQRRSSVGRPLVLLVEDNPINARLGERILKSIGYDVLMAADGQQAVDACLTTPNIAGVLCDLQMPVMDGIQATKQIRTLEATGTLQSRLPIIALTANVDSKEACQEVGFDDFLSKPLKISDLERTLQRHLHIDRTPQS